MNCRKFAFAGFRHGHIFALYNALKAREDTCIVGAWEADDEARAQAQAKGVEFTYASYAQLLADPEVEIVAIGDYFAARGNLALQALKAGKHVLADKPLCTTQQELEAIRQEARTTGLAVGMMLDLRDNPKLVTAMDAINKGMIGKVSNVCFEGQHPLMYGSRPGWYFEEGKHGGVINDIAIHGIDLLRRFTGSSVAKVLSARCWNFYADKEPAFKDCAQFMLEMESGAGVIADVSYAAPDVQLFGLPTYWHFRVWGDKGLLDFGMNIPDVTLYAKGESGGRVLEQIQADKTYLDTFLSVLPCAEARAAYTEDNLISAKQTLLVQKAADEA